ncbi:2Fe-2S iron-sulfur cluster-binding protein [Nocardia sp. NPDC003345]
MVPSFETEPHERSGAGIPITFRYGRQTVSGEHRNGATLLESARYLGLNPPAICEAGHCGACTARVIAGDRREMRRNSALTEAEVAGGWVLMCQTVPAQTSVRVVVEYEEVRYE